VLELYLGLTNHQAKEVIENQDGHTLEPLRMMPWIAALGDIANSGKDWRRACDVKCCDVIDRPRATKFCIQCTFGRYVGDGPFMVCNSDMCLLKHKEDIGPFSYNSKRSKLERKREDISKAREGTKELKKIQIRAVNAACSEDQTKLRKRAKELIRDINSKKK